MNAAKVALPLVAVVLAALGAPTVATAATVSVDCDTQSLQDAIDDAAPATILAIQGTCVGPVIVNKDLTLKGVAPATLDGELSGSALTVAGNHVIHLRSLVVTGGSGTDGGGIAMPDGGTLTLDGVTLRDNVALTNTGGIAQGGGLFVRGGAVTIRNSTFLRNAAINTTDGIEFARGGAVDVDAGTLTVAGSSFKSNRALTTATRPNSSGGAIFSRVTPTTITGSSFTGNVASALLSDDFGFAEGGGVDFAADLDETLSIAGSTFTSNIATATGTGVGLPKAAGGALGINAGAGAIDVTGTRFEGNTARATSEIATAVGEGGAITASGSTLVMDLTSSEVLDSTVITRGARSVTFGGGVSVHGTLTVDGSIVAGNHVTARAGSATGTAVGGGIAAENNAVLALRRSTIEANVADATSEGSVGDAQGGGIEAEQGGVVDVRSSTIDANVALAASGNASPSALGGGLDLETDAASDRILNSTITRNAATATGPNAIAAGGAVEVADGSFVVQLATIARNGVTASGTNSFAGGGGLDVEEGTTRLEGVIVAINQAVTGQTCIGSITTDGFNVFGPTAGCTVTPVATDQANVAKPKLGALHGNGGPTQTLALLADSPAVNRIPATACHDMATRDQRGTPRPQGTKCDVGAFERKI